MSKSIIIAAAISALVVATPALAQDRGKPAGTGSTGFGGRNGSAIDLRDAPGRDTADRIPREIRSSGVAEPRETSEAPPSDTGGHIKREIRCSGVVTPR